MSSFSTSLENNELARNYTSFDEYTSLVKGDSIETHEPHSIAYNTFTKFVHILERTRDLLFFVKLFVFKKEKPLFDSRRNEMLFIAY